MDVSVEARRAASRNRTLALILILNLILLGWLLYTSFARSVLPGGGVSLLLYNDTVFPMVDMTLSYPGGKLVMPRIEPGQGVGHPVQVPAEFEATLTFKDDDGHAFKETIPIQPVEQLLIRIHVLPVWEESAVKAADGKEEAVYRPSSSKLHIITTYQGENKHLK